ncbi:MAG: 3-deoxy-7-phosphoheptulonate synthase [Clostridia bacterium]|nr:3-deoxy-7-phosphoheptulonate synthase [Lachnospiraceae bacterium]NCC00004.1 3-deoxy-7-phosphoheptulonate synthase [Clostridia bacterium]NCD03546.1 3-deoxy-7-phosphoheptulonate synthase [Clostridia bacterium]
MGFDFKMKLPVPKEIKELYPVNAATAARKKELDQQIIDVITGKSDKFLAIIGPCSADNKDSVYEYIERLTRVQEKIKDKVIIVPRIYTNKPRTTGEGYKGMLHQPDPEKAPDLLQGIIAIRQLHMHALETYGMPIADEMLYPENYWYLSDILSYVAIGARSVEDQQHRLVTSGFDVPAGMKNPTSGDFSVMLNSVVAAQASHNFIYRGWDVTTDGNPYAHTILRGSVNKYSRSRPNYHYEDIMKLNEMYAARNLKNPAAIVDANHSNSDKQFKEQIRIVKEVLHSRSLSNDIRNLVKGVMIESYLVEGTQKIGCENHVYGKSITDPCLGWEDSEALLYEIAERC